MSNGRQQLSRKNRLEEGTSARACRLSGRRGDLEFAVRILHFVVRRVPVATRGERRGAALTTAIVSVCWCTLTGVTLCAGPPVHPPLGSPPTPRPWNGAPNAVPPLSQTGPPTDAPSGSADSQGGSPDGTTASKEARETLPLQRIESTVIPNWHRLTATVWCGGEPVSIDGLKALAERGITTVVSVDGATPPVDDAQRLGMRYIHIPIGYHGISREQIVDLSAALRDSPGPVFVHCHRGLHRGPAAVVTALKANGLELSSDASERLLRQLGTAPKYAGLYAAAKTVAPLTADERNRRGTDLPAAVPGAPLVQQMVTIAHDWEELQKRAQPPGAFPQAAAVALGEHLVESGRLLQKSLSADRPERGSQAAEAVQLQLATELQRDGHWWLKWLDEELPRDAGAAAAGLQQLQRRCDRCHAVYRDRAR